MRQLLIILFLLSSVNLYSQVIDKVGELKLSGATISASDTVVENICGLATKTVRLTIYARTKVQLSCNFGDPSKDIYDTVKNKIYLYYKYDSTGIIHDSVISEIKRYVEQQEAWAKQYNMGKDFSYSAFDKSFYVNGETTIPFISTVGENRGDYKLFYLNNQVYKIVLAESKGLGCLSSFVHQNMYFTKNGQRIKLGKYIKNTDTARQIFTKD